MSFFEKGYPFPVFRTAAEKQAQSKTVFVRLTKEVLAAWDTPRFQRDIIDSPNLMRVVDSLIKTGILPTTVLLGMWGDDGKIYKLDGNQRLRAVHLALESGQVPHILAEAKCTKYVTEAAAEHIYSIMQKQINRSTPDHVLKGKQVHYPELERLYENCQEILTYGSTSTKEGRPLSTARAIRCWENSRFDPPVKTGRETSLVAKDLTQEDVDHLIELLPLLLEAWGCTRVEDRGLWGDLNLTMSMWLYRRMVLGESSSAPCTRLTREQFCVGVAALLDAVYRSNLSANKLQKAHKAAPLSELYNKFLKPLRTGIRLSGYSKTVKFPRPKGW